MADLKYLVRDEAGKVYARASGLSDAVTLAGALIAAGAARYGLELIVETGGDVQATVGAMSGEDVLSGRQAPTETETAISDDVGVSDELRWEPGDAVQE